MDRLHSGKSAPKPLSCDINTTLDYFTLYPAKCTDMPVDIRFMPRHAGFSFIFGSLGWAGWSIIRVWTAYAGTSDFFFPNFWSTHCPVQWVLGSVSPMVKRAEREADHLPLSSVMVKNARMLIL